MLSKFIDEQYLSLNSLQETENKYKIKFPFNLKAYCFSMPKKNTVDAKVSACKLFSYSKEELAQLTIPEFSVDPEKKFDQFENIIKDELQKNSLLHIKPKAGKRISTEITTGILLY